ncbi:hypothetical protein KVT40_001654 [Elsinoe batatas]|uniref:Uncharacterized protein n=1 Tax=Elsinoe batatas TaxID=2601811 RepID=A0A8K0L726_9PEZI|nr:hypothetical protein KVT40_001654 [Elsinoe batatas]
MDDSREAPPRERATGNTSLRELLQLRTLHSCKDPANPGSAAEDDTESTSTIIDIVPLPAPSMHHLKAQGEDVSTYYLHPPQDTKSHILEGTNGRTLHAWNQDVIACKRRNRVANVHGSGIAKRPRKSKDTRRKSKDKRGGKAWGIIPCVHGSRIEVSCTTNHSTPATSCRYSDCRRVVENELVRSPTR